MTDVTKLHFPSRVRITTHTPMRFLPKTFRSKLGEFEVPVPEHLPIDDDAKALVWRELLRATQRAHAAEERGSRDPNRDVRQTLCLILSQAGRGHSADWGTAARSAVRRGMTRAS